MLDGDNWCFKYLNDECWSGQSKRGFMHAMEADGWSTCSALEFQQAYALHGLGDKKLPGGKQCLQDISGNNFCVVDIKTICNSLLLVAQFPCHFTKHNFLQISANKTMIVKIHIFAIMDSAGKV